MTQVSDLIPDLSTVDFHDLASILLAKFRGEAKMHNLDTFYCLPKVFYFRSK